ncbi:ATP synthase F1 subunit epsilon [Mycoplasmopsis columbina]|uniref:ATP synthase epsilon chain n=1 Tax=Mycoplasmopsis columbina SF7 TaxID=1037410 RepID=F9UJQ4_9BACT|nr:ATP synthase F1 subunit epsilon [Mycoplasmopsis columbina]EGV00435.1 ATP synthase F1, epsilon subunit [Mycoplasmopsis columbina SF7]VEU76700.1 ATP synthase epsilon chain [Mycoplasmopsis columbina]
MNNKTYLTIVTVDKIFYQDYVQFVNLKTVEGGDITFLPNHSPFVSNIDVCKMIIKEENGDFKYCSIGSGLVYVDANEIRIITDDIIFSKDINIHRAELEKESMISKIKTAKTKNEKAIYEFKLRKAINRINVYNNK